MFVASNSVMTAGYQKIFSSSPKLGFLAQARSISETLSNGGLPAGIASLGDAHRVVFNAYMNAAVAAFFMLSVVVILTASAREWWSVISGEKAPRSTEVPFEPRAYAAGD